MHFVHRRQDRPIRGRGLQVTPVQREQQDGQLVRAVTVEALRWIGASSIAASRQTFAVNAIYTGAGLG